MMPSEPKAGMTASGVRYAYSFCKLTPKELAEATGLSVEMQRVWRRRDQLPASVGTPTRFTSRDAAQVLVRYELSRYGLAPSDSGTLSECVAPSVLWFALLEADGTCEIIGDLEEVTKVLHDFDAESDIARCVSGAETVWQYMWRADGGEIALTNDRQEMGGPGDHFAVFYMDLSTAGILLADRIRRPLVTLEVTGSPTSKKVRRLTGRKER